MAQKKTLFGYLLPIQPVSEQKSSDWFDVSTFLIHGQDTLPEEEQEKPHFAWGKLLVGLAALGLVFRLSNLQITQGSAHRFLAEGNRLRRQITVAPRGSIVDRKGNQLVINEPGYRLELVPSDLPVKKQDREAIYKVLAEELKVDRQTVIKQVEQVGITSLDPIILKANIVREEALVDKIKFAHVPAVHVSFVPSRRYDSTPGLSHILGYTSVMTEDDQKHHPDYYPTSPIGRSGVESSYDRQLRGQVGTNEIEVDANGKFQRVIQNIPPKEGDILHLTLDIGLQKEMVEALKEAMDKEKAKEAVAVAMDPKTGGILAIVSLPSYDNNLFAKGINGADYAKLNNDPDKPLLDRALDGLYPSGSTVKPFIAAAALQEGTISPQTKLDTSAGKIKIGQWEFPDWKVHGVADVQQAIAESNDIFFYALGGGYNQIPGLGIERMKRYLHMFGFGKSSGVDFAPEQEGLVPDEAWKEKMIKEPWYIGDTYHVAIGQGDLLVTPLQMARALSAMANGGTLVTPHIVDAVEPSDTNKMTSLTYPRDKLGLRDDVIKTVQSGMRRTVENGSARILNTLPFTSAGKTGTAEFGTEHKTHAWYVGYAPYEDPQIAVAVIVPGGGEGNAVAAPVAGRIFSYYMKNK